MKRTLKELNDFLWNYLSMRHDKEWFPFTDLVLFGWYVKENHIPFFALKHAIVQHIGNITTGLSGLKHQHYSRRFDDQKQLIFP